MKPLDIVAAEWVDARGDDGTIGHFRHAQVLRSLEELLLQVRREALTSEAIAAEKYENEACAWEVDQILGVGNTVSARIRARMKGA